VTSRARILGRFFSAPERFISTLESSNLQRRVVHTPPPGHPRLPAHHRVPWPGFTVRATKPSQSFRFKITADGRAASPSTHPLSDALPLSSRLQNITALLSVFRRRVPCCFLGLRPGARKLRETAKGPSYHPLSRGISPPVSKDPRPRSCPAWMRDERPTDASGRGACFYARGFYYFAFSLTFPIATG